MDVRACGVLGGFIAGGVCLAGVAAMSAGCSSADNAGTSAAGTDGSVQTPVDSAVGEAEGSTTGPQDDASSNAIPDAADGGPNCAGDGGSATFTCTGSMTTARDVPGGVTLPNGKVLVAGGWNAQNGVLSDAELYDPATGAFSATGAMSSGHLWAGWGAAWPLVGGRVLVAGGLDADGALVPTAELYDPATGTFAPTGPLGVGTISMAPVVLDDGTVLFIGGWEDVSPQTKAELPSWSYTGSGTSLSQTFEPDAGDGGAFVRSGALGETRLFGCNVRVPGGALAIGGAEGPAAIEPNIERFDIEAGTWSSVGSLTAGTFCARAFVLPSGKVLLTGTGGLSGATAPIPGMLVFDPATNALGPTKNAIANFSPNLVQLANGDVLAFGGTLSGAPTAVAQVYQAATNMWHTVGNMTEPRSGAVGAYLLPSGNVLIAGGDDATGMPLATAEVYNF
jgi:hypothetical protein